MSIPNNVPGTDVPREFLEPLGYLTIWFSLLEAELHVALWRMLDLGLDDRRGPVVTAQFTSFKGKAMFLQALVNERVKQGKEPILKAIDAALNVNVDRNALIHGEWLVAALMPDVAFKTSHNAKQGKLKSVISKAYTPEKIMQIAEDAIAAAGSLQVAVRDALDRP